MEELNPEASNIHESGSAFHSSEPEFNIMDTALNFVTEYGWFLLIASVVFMYFWKTRFEQRWKEWRHQVTTSREVQQYCENPEKLMSMQDAMTAARMRMQEKNNQLSSEEVVRMKEKEEMKRLEKIKELEKRELGLGTRLRTRTDQNDSSSPSALGRKSKDSGRLRGNYNPLMGSSSGTTYRPNRPDCSSSGG